MLVDSVPFSKGVITGKIFDYLCLNGCILAIAPDDSEIGDILKKTKKGKLISKHSAEEISEFLLDVFKKWRKGIKPTSDLNFDEISKFSYSKQLIALKNILDKLENYEA